MTRRAVIVAMALCGLLAFCIDSTAKTLDLIENEQVRAYSQNEFERGAPSLPVTAKILHREALEDLSHGRRSAAVEKLRLAASLSGDGAGPLFTLARVELLSGNPDFLMTFGEGLRRSFTAFPGAALAALNWGALAALALVGGLFTLLLSLLFRHWAFISHTIAEIRWLRHRKFPAEWILPLAALALACLRIGLGLYIAALICVLWAYLARRERIVVCSIVAVVSAASFLAPWSNCLAPATDPGSATRQLSLVNERSVSSYRLAGIRAIDGSVYRAERDYAVGTMLYRLGLYGEARAYLLEAVSENPEFAPAFINLGNVYFTQGDYDKALAGYRSAIEIDSASAVAHYNIGQAYIKKMLFAQSGASLQRASTLGIEAYRASQPALAMRSAVVYEQNFPSNDLWRIASAEGRGRERVILSEMLEPFLLFPFHRLWILLLASFAVSVLIARKLPKELRAERCDNCGLPTCPRCRETVHGIALCRECCKAIKEISSAKVMEVLLRTRRQKVDDSRGRTHRFRTALLPGMAHVHNGRPLVGFLVAFAGTAAAGTLYWRGLYFKDPLAMNVGVPAWETLISAAVLAASYSLALFTKNQQENRNYHIFSSETRSLEREEAPAKRSPSSGQRGASSGLWLSPDSTSPERKKTARDEGPKPERPEPAKKPSVADTLWGNDPPPAPPRGNAARETARDASEKNAGAQKSGFPGPPAKAVDTDDLLAEIKKGSSWH